MSENAIQQATQQMFADMGVAISLSSAILCDNHHEALGRVVTGQKYALMVTDITGITIPRDGDVFVGFLGAGDCIVDLFVGPTRVSTHKIRDGEFKYAIDDRFVVPYICSRFHEVTVRVTGSRPRVVHAFIGGFEQRRDMCRNGAYVPREPSFVFKHGVGAFEPTRPSVRAMICLPDMRDVPEDCCPPEVLPCVLKPAHVRRIVHMCVRELSSTPQLYDMPDEARRMMAEACADLGLELVGTRWTLGNTAVGMHKHRDESYQGGARTLLVYLTTPESGGATVFETTLQTMRVELRAGDGVAFGVRVMHGSDASVGDKLVAAVEVRATMEGKWDALRATHHRAALRIQRPLRESMSNPAYRMCRRRLLTEFVELRGVT